MPAIVLILVVAIAVALLIAALSTWRGRRSVAFDGQTATDPGPWHRHVSPIFFMLVVAAGVLIGFVIVAVALDFVS